MSKPRIGITIGDPAGIGPEIVKKAINSPQIKKICTPVIIGDRRFILGREKLPKKSPFEIVDMPYNDISKVKPGVYSADTGLMSYHYVARSIELAHRKIIDAVVTAPISKEAFRLAGIEYSGHTEMFADFTRTEDFAMLMVSGKLRTVMVTRHMPLCYACKNISQTNILACSNTAVRFLDEKMKIKKPRVVVCALNPHAGEGGLLGEEERIIIAPAVEALRKAKINAQGPVPADSAWLKLKRGEFDLLIAMYHDQAMIPLKALAPERIVNITAGLPFIRTSPGHGTAFDIAGKEKADPSSMIEAIKAAVQLSKSSGRVKG